MYSRAQSRHVTNLPTTKHYDDNSDDKKDNAAPIKNAKSFHVSPFLNRVENALAERGVPGEVYNVCSGQGYSVADVTALALDRAGVQAQLVTDESLRALPLIGGVDQWSDSTDVRSTPAVLRRARALYGPP